MRFRQLRERIADCIAGYAEVGAEEVYYASDRVLGYLLIELEDEGDPAARSAILRAMAGLEYARSRAHTPALGPDPNEDEGGRDVAESDRLASALLYLLAGIESAVCMGQECIFDGRFDWTWLTAEGRDVAQRMAATPDLPTRHAMLANLYDAVHPLVGGQAAEVIACIPAPDCGPLRPYVPTTAPV
jgi:hypothetical protein